MCRRCSDCINCSHHWIYSPPSEDMNAPDHECKHCNAIGDTCRECWGDGCDPAVVSANDFEDCPECGGEGVILVAGGDVVFTRNSDATNT